MAAHPLTFLLALALAPAVTASPSEMKVERVQYAEVTVRSHVVIRVERAVVVAAPPLASLYREKRGPSCIDMADVAGAAVIAPGSVDMALRTGKRIRARFAASCPGLDYYSGFYIAPTADGKFCASRDAIRDRAGGECSVVHFREVVPRK